MTEPVFSDSQIKEDASNRQRGTGQQAGVAGFIVVVGLWVAHQVGWKGDMPAEVATATTGLLTWAGSVWANRRRVARLTGNSD